ncbi:MAG: FKBP-type peptidyl-prolyl cis-trans isomerase, partial [Thermoleophilia bacterium]|nr:FKBP-type peptidyl-prolyl cis-trans isomerase [Thermoleophilia bacterium]
SAGGNWSGAGAGPTLIDGAFEFNTSWVVTADSLSFTDRGIDAAGKQVWGPAQGAAGPTFKRSAPVATAEKRQSGVVTIDFVPPKATERKLEENGEAAGVVIGYTDTGAEFYSSLTPNPRTGMVEPYRWTAAPQGGVPGWNTGMAGVTQGTVRRVFVPAPMGFGVRGNRNVPPNADLIFTTEVQWVGEPKAPAPAGPASGAVVPSAGASDAGKIKPLPQPPVKKN